MRVGWCDVCTDFTNVIKVNDVNNSDGKARLKRQKSPETRDIGILGIQDIQGIQYFHGFQAFAILSDPKLPLNNIFLCGLAANNTTCVCVYKYFERLPHNAPDDRNPITLKYKTTDKIVL